MKGGRTWAVNGLILAGAIVVGLVLAEAGLRLFYPQPLGVWHQDRHGLAVHWPGLVAHLSQFGVSASFNSDGMRDREHAVEKAPGVFRILILGDSFMEALQVPFERSFASLLEREVATRAGRPVEVVNASVSGWGTDDQLEYLRRYGMKWHADLVLVAMTLHNDLSDNLRERFHTIRDGVLVERDNPALGLLQYKLVELKGLLATHSHAYQLVLKARRQEERVMQAMQLESHVAELFRMDRSPQMARALTLTELMLGRLARIAERGGGRGVLVLLPLAVQVLDQERAVAQGGSDGPQQALREIGSRSGMEVIDLLPGFRDRTRGAGARVFLGHDGHWAEEGHALAASLVAPELVGRALVR